MSFPQFQFIARIKATGVSSLAWMGDTLVDWAAGGNCYHLDGKVSPRAVVYAFRFDAACISPSGRFAIIYERLGTKGAILKEGQILREINRSFYHAGAFEYPVCIARRDSGQEVLIHCPDEYDRLEIEDIESGECLTTCDKRQPADFFHSRLAVDATGAYFLSAGWIWHPIDVLGVYGIEEAIRKPMTLDELGRFSPQSTEISSAAFTDDQRVLLSTSDLTFANDEDLESADNALRPDVIAVWDIEKRTITSQAPLAEPAGTLMPVNSRYAVGFHEYPKLIDVRSGHVVARLSDVATGKQTSSIIHHLDRLPPLAIDLERRRFPCATPTEILVVAVEPPN